MKKTGYLENEAVYVKGFEDREDTHLIIKDPIIYGKLQSQYICSEKQYACLLVYGQSSATNEYFILPPPDRRVMKFSSQTLTVAFCGLEFDGKPSKIPYCVGRSSPRSGHRDPHQHLSLVADTIEEGCISKI